jgi:hypothetical protein
MRLRFRGFAGWSALRESRRPVRTHAGSPRGRPVWFPRERQRTRASCRAAAAPAERIADDRRRKPSIMSSAHTPICVAECLPPGWTNVCSTMTSAHPAAAR